jgi:hypothetical protein
MKAKYRDNMTPAEEKQLMDKIAAEDALYAAVDAAMVAQRPFGPEEEPEEDEMELLMKAGLSRGQP